MKVSSSTAFCYPAPPHSHTQITKEEALKMYNIMALVPVVDNILYQSQRQGRISFYMQCAGEEAAIVGSAAAMHPGDEVFAQYVGV